MKTPLRYKDSEHADPLARELLQAARPSVPMPQHRRLLGARRVARLASVPLVGLGVGLWSKGVAAAFGLGFVSAMALVAVSPAVRGRLESRHAAPVPENDAQHRIPGPAPARVTAVPAFAEAPVSASATAPPIAAREPPPSVESAPRVLESSNVARAALRPSPVVAAPPIANATASPAVSAEAPRAPSEPAISAELGLLHEARRLVSTDPTAAISTLQRHASSFPDGTLAAEREVLLVEALQRSGRGDEAALRASELLANAPRGIYAPRLRRVLEANRAR
jgi:hypothetical protein